jgi:hypothetical protein
MRLFRAATAATSAEVARRRSKWLLKERGKFTRLFGVVIAILPILDFGFIFPATKKPRDKFAAFAGATHRVGTNKKPRGVVRSRLDG